MTQYYAYKYLDPSTNEPFYVGKGHGDRAYSHWRGGWTHNKRFNNRLIGMRKRGIEPIIQIIECADEQAAFDLERKLIAEYGRKDLGTGPLYNCTDGGEGPCGFKHTEATKAKMRGRIVGPKTRQLLSSIAEGMWFNNGIVESRTKKCPKGFVAGRLNKVGLFVSNNQRGVPKSKAHRLALSKAHMGISPWNKGKVTGKHWFTDGKVNKSCFTQPDGFRPGRTI